ncbi:MAG: hypothetical protein DMD31_10740 [Gemmatimonadetes bacterium]|nr:MAG: hypothetical protein DMD31_10740 [Gemmatimonadota bacterium]
MGFKFRRQHVIAGFIVDFGRIWRHLYHPLHRPQHGGGWPRLGRRWRDRRAHRRGGPEVAAAGAVSSAHG